MLPRLARDLLGHLPRGSGARAAACAVRGRPGGAIPRRAVPDDPRRVYDVRDVLARSSTAASCSSSRTGWARNMVTALARIDGRPVGVIANQPRYLGGVIDAAAAEKAALFVDCAASFGLPLVVLVDTPGFMPGAAPGERRRDPPRRVAAACVRRRPGAEADRRSAQGLRRRRDHDELEGSRRRPRLRLARRRDRDHGRDARRSGSSTGATLAEAPRTPTRRRPSSPTTYADSHLGADRRGGLGLRRRGDRAAATRARLAWALGALER